MYCATFSVSHTCYGQEDTKDDTFLFVVVIIFAIRLYYARRDTHKGGSDQMNSSNYATRYRL
jgi:hypothetical protein